MWAELPPGRKVYISHASGMPDRAYGTKNDSDFRGRELCGEPLKGAPTGTYFCILGPECGDGTKRSVCICDVLSSSKIDIDCADVLSRISTVRGIEGLDVVDYKDLSAGGIYDVSRKMTRESGRRILLMSRHDIGSFSALSGAIWRPPFGNGCKVLEITRDGRAVAVAPRYNKKTSEEDDSKIESDPTLRSSGDWLDYDRVDVGPVFNFDPSYHEYRRRYVCYMCTSSGERGWIVAKPAKQTEPISLREYIDRIEPMEGPRMFSVLGQ